MPCLKHVAGLHMGAILEIARSNVWCKSLKHSLGLKRVSQWG